MRTRIGKVTNIYPSIGKVKVMYEDEGSASLPLSMLTMNQEYSMPAVGDRVVTIHMENGSSKGFILGTYYGGGMQPKANTGYRKDFGSGAYAICRSGAYSLKAGSVNLSGSAASVSLGSNAAVTGTEVVLGSAAASEDENEEIKPDVYLKITEEDLEAEALTDITAKAEGGKIDLTAEAAEAHLLLDAESELKALVLTVDADDLIFRCLYGEESFENILKRLERIEDRIGLPHTI